MQTSEMASCIRRQRRIPQPVCQTHPWKLR